MGQPGDKTIFGRVDIGGAWANVSNTPFKLFKHFVHNGGIGSPMSMHWPNGMDPAVMGTMSIRWTAPTWRRSSPANELELYDLSVDPAENNNIATSNPAKLQELMDAWNTWAEDVGVPSNRLLP